MRNGTRGSPHHLTNSHVVQFQWELYVSKDFHVQWNVQGHSRSGLQSSLAHAGLVGMLMFLHWWRTSKRCKGELGISRNPLCLLHLYEVYCRAEWKQQRSLNYIHSHQCYKKKFLFPSCCLQPHMVCCGNSPVTKLGGWPAIHAKDDAYSKWRNCCFRGRKIHCWCHKLYPSIVNNFCPSS